eukprot:scaffold7688_cov130-Isochrysis_galbana.AAC.18
MHSAVASVTLEPMPARDYSNVASGTFAAKLLEESLKYRSVSTKFQARPAQVHDLGPPISESATTIAATAHAATPQPSMGVTLEGTFTASVTEEASQAELVSEPMLANAAAAHEPSATASDPVAETPFPPTAAPVFKVMTGQGFEELVGTESLASYFASR